MHEGARQGEVQGHRRELHRRFRLAAGRRRWRSGSPRTRSSGGKTAEASAWARKALTADPGFAEALVLLGGAEQELGRRAEARAAYLRYLELAPRGKHASDVQSLLRRL